MKNKIKNDSAKRNEEKKSFETRERLKRISNDDSVVS